MRIYMAVKGWKQRKEDKKRRPGESESSPLSLLNKASKEKLIL